jgi:DNA-binding CsgD family transcriptional regulator
MRPPPIRERIDWDEAVRLQREGQSCAEIARELEYSPITVRRALRARGVELRGRPIPAEDRWRTALYRTWRWMRAKCRSRSSRSYAQVGARGIDFCAEWEQFQAFERWARRTRFRPGLALDRLRLDRDFTPRNCRWVSVAELHKKLARHDPVWTIEAFGERKGPTAWSRDRRCKVSLPALLRRIEAGWQAEAAIATRPGEVSPASIRRRPATRPGIERLDPARLRKLLERGLTCMQIAPLLGSSHKTVRLHARRLGLYRPPPVGLTSTKRGDHLYKIWHSMLRRGRGSGADRAPRVCRQWRTFDGFRAWALGSDYRLGRSLVRKNPRSGWSPAGCVWAAKSGGSEFRLPPSRPAPPRWMVRAFGEVKGPTAWSRDPRCRVSLPTLIKRLRSGESSERAITDPPMHPGTGSVYFRPVRAFDITKGFMDWVRDPRCKVRYSGLHDRLRRGWTPEDAILTPPFCKPAGGSRRAAKRKGARSGS